VTTDDAAIFPSPSGLKAFAKSPLQTSHTEVSAAVLFESDEECNSCATTSPLYDQKCHAERKNLETLSRAERSTLEGARVETSKEVGAARTPPHHHGNFYCDFPVSSLNENTVY